MSNLPKLKLIITPKPDADTALCSLARALVEIGRVAKQARFQSRRQKRRLRKRRR